MDNDAALRKVHLLDSVLRECGPCPSTPLVETPPGAQRLWIDEYDAIIARLGNLYPTTITAMRRRDEILHSLTLKCSYRCYKCLGISPPAASGSVRCNTTSPYPVTTIAKSPLESCGTQSPAGLIALRQPILRTLFNLPLIGTSIRADANYRTSIWTTWLTNLAFSRGQSPSR